MYDSGGISLKPGDAVHATMKNDMSGAGALLATMLSLSKAKCPTAVTAYLVCTDNMPSGTAVKLGDVMTVRGGTTVEIINTDAEGRLVMADALVLATELKPDAILDIATLTGACMRALGEQVAGVMGNNAALIDQVRAAGEATDEPLWELPLERRYRSQLDSDVADIKNLGGANAGAITAALFLETFVGDVPWAHIDIAGTAQSDMSAPWRPAGLHRIRCAVAAADCARLRGQAVVSGPDDSAAADTTEAPEKQERPPQHHRTHRRQGSSPGGHLHRSVCTGDRAVAGAVPVRRARDQRDRRAGSDRGRNRAIPPAPAFPNSYPSRATRAPSTSTTTKSSPRRSRSKVSSPRTVCDSCSRRRCRTSTASASSA